VKRAIVLEHGDAVGTVGDDDGRERAPMVVVVEPEREENVGVGVAKGDPFAKVRVVGDREQLAQKAGRLHRGLIQTHVCPSSFF